MDMRDRAKAKHVACHPAQRLTGNFLDIRIIATGRPTHPRQRILDRKACRGHIIGRGGFITDAGVRYGRHGTKPTVTVHHQAGGDNTVPQHPAARPHHVRLDFKDLALFMRQRAGLHIVDDRCL